MIKLSAKEQALLDDLNRISDIFDKWFVETQCGLIVKQGIGEQSSRKQG